MTNDRDLLIGYLEGSLASEDVERLERRLASDENLRQELSRLRSIGQVLSNSRAEAFGAFFVDRTMRAIRPVSIDPSVSLYESLRWVFVRTVVASLAIVVILSALNVMDFNNIDVASTWIEAAFGLPSTTVEDAFTYGFI